MDVATADKIGTLAASEEKRKAFLSSESATQSILDLAAALVVEGELSEEKELLVSKCARALGNLCIDEPDARIRVAECKGVNALLKCCTNHASNPLVSKMCVGALSNLSAGDEPHPFVTTEWIAPVFDVLGSCVKQEHDELRLWLALQTLNYIGENKAIQTAIFDNKMYWNIIVQIGERLLSSELSPNGNFEDIEDSMLSLISAISTFLHDADEPRVRWIIGHPGLLELLINSIQVMSQDEVLTLSLSMLKACFLLDKTIDVKLPQIKVLFHTMETIASTAPTSENCITLLQLIVTLAEHMPNLAHFLTCLAQVKSLLQSSKPPMRAFGYELVAKVGFDDEARQTLVTAGIVNILLNAIVTEAESPFMLCAITGALRNLALLKNVAEMCIDADVATHLIDKVLTQPVQEKALILKAQFHALKLLRTLWTSFSSDSKQVQALSGVMTAKRVLVVMNLATSDASHVRWEAGRVVAGLLSEGIASAPSLCGPAWKALTPDTATQEWTNLLPLLCCLASSQHEQLQTEGSTALLVLCSERTESVAKLAPLYDEWITKLLNSQTEEKDEKTSDSKTKQPYLPDKLVPVSLTTVLCNLMSSTVSDIRRASFLCCYKLLTISSFTRNTALQAAANTYLQSDLDEVTLETLVKYCGTSDVTTLMEQLK